MRALRFDRLGDLDALHSTDLPAPQPADGEVLVRVVAAGLNPSDVKNVLGRFPYTTLPRTPGRDFAGVVEAGPVDMIGREVWGTGNELGFRRDGSHAEYLTLPADGTAPRPRSLSFAQCAASGVPYTTAFDALARTGVSKGARVVIMGVGAVGRAAIDVARWRGARVVAGVRRPEQAEELRGRGVPCIVLGDPSVFGDAVHARFHEGADVIFDTTGAWLEPSVYGLAPFGRIAVIAAPADNHARLPVLALYRKGGGVVGINSLLYDARACAKMLVQLGAAFDAGDLPAPEPPAEIPFASAVEAYHRQHRGPVEKVVFAMGAARA